MTLGSIATHLGVARQTVREWVKSGKLVAYSIQSAHYSDERPRKTSRATIRVRLDDWNRFLETYRGGMKK